MNQQHLTTEIKTYRPGLRGVWDHFKAVLTRNEPIHVLTDVTFSVYVNNPVKLAHSQLEWKKPE